MKTGTFKDIIACYTIAYCIHNGISEFVTQSSGNTANSIAYYASLYKIKATILYPKKSRYKIRKFDYDKSFVRFIEVDKAGEDIKAFTQEISETFKIPWLPKMEHQIHANEVRAHLLKDVYSEMRLNFDYTSQSLSSGYGVFGLYDGYWSFNISPFPIPRFIGVQQKSVNPYYRHIYNAELAEDELLEPTLFRRIPTSEMLAQMKDIVSKSNGHITNVDTLLFNSYEEKATSLLASREIPLTSSDGQIIEKSGLISLIGVLDLIDKDQIKKDCSILAAITGSDAKGDRNCFIPTWTVGPNDTFEEVEAIMQKKNGEQHFA
ncbi:MAG: PLP-dependent lyase/thiolase [Flavobacteriales bacterium]|nr:PLP-dependent lyase/thiolase [Flavobacteriales bacterium]